MTIEEAINIIAEMVKDEEGFLSDNTVEAHKIAIKALEQEPKTGHWIRITNGGAMKQMYICSECRRRIEDDGIEALITIKYPYCHCGARMEVEQNG